VVAAPRLLSVQLLVWVVVVAVVVVAAAVCVTARLTLGPLPLLASLRPSRAV
jgi:hypothetical protein